MVPFMRQCGKSCKTGQATDDNMAWIHVIYLCYEYRLQYFFIVFLFSRTSPRVCQSMLIRVPSRCTSAVKSWQNNVTLTVMRSSKGCERISKLILGKLTLVSVKLIKWIGMEFTRSRRNKR